MKIQLFELGDGIYSIKINEVESPALFCSADGILGDDIRHFSSFLSDNCITDTDKGNLYYSIIQQYIKCTK